MGREPSQVAGRGASRAKSREVSRALFASELWPARRDPEDAVPASDDRAACEALIAVAAANAGFAADQAQLGKTKVFLRKHAHDALETDRAAARPRCAARPRRGCPPCSCAAAPRRAP